MNPITITRTLRLNADGDVYMLDGHWAICAGVVNRFRKKNYKTRFPNAIQVTISNVTFTGSKPIYIKVTDDADGGYRALGYCSPSSWGWSKTKENETSGGLFMTAIDWIRRVFQNNELQSSSPTNPLPLYVRVTVAK